MDEKISTFLDLVYEKNPRQKKSIIETIDMYYTPEDFEQFEEVLRYYCRTHSIQKLAEAYNLLVEDTAKETKYFLINEKYRYSSFEETQKLIYNNKEYMDKYMIGLALSGYLWPNHIKMFRWYQKVLRNEAGNRFLEVGPGHGRYYCEAVKQGGFMHYDAIDVSETSVEQTKKCVDFYLDNLEKEKCEIFLQNAYEYNPYEKYDFIVIAEVLEHLEKPKEMLQKLYEISNNNSKIYITVPVNAPAIDHIYLFNTIEIVEDMVTSVGYRIEDRLYATAGDMELDKAKKRKNSILVGLVALKENR